MLIFILKTFISLFDSYLSFWYVFTHFLLYFVLKMGIYYGIWNFVNKWEICIRDDFEKLFQELNWDNKFWDISEVLIKGTEWNAW